METTTTVTQHIVPKPAAAAAAPVRAGLALQFPR
jgi:hypothetical protein